MTAVTAADTPNPNDAEGSVPPPDSPVSDLDVIFPEPGEPIVIGGIQARVKHLKAREFFALMRILTNGVGPNLMQLQLRGSTTEELTGAMSGLLLMAIPNAIEEFFILVRDIVEPVDPKVDGRRLQEYLKNPEIDDLLPVLDQLLVQESDNIRSLVGKARAYLARWQEMWRRQQQ